MSGYLRSAMNSGNRCRQWATTHPAEARRLVLILVLALAALIRIVSVNTKVQLDNDEAQYAGVARDYLETGQFLETVASRAHTHFIPIGYPSLIVLLCRITGLDVHTSGVVVNVILGSLIAYLTAWGLVGLGAPLLLVFFAGAFVSLNLPLIKYSVMVMTENLFIVLLLLLFFLILDIFKKTTLKSWALYGLAMGVLGGLSFLARAGGLYLLGAVPITVWLLAVVKGRLREWKNLIVVTLIFGVTMMGIVLANSYRLYLWNGYFTLSPQIAGNLEVGEVIATGNLDVQKLDDEGVSPRLQKKLKESKGAVSQWLSQPLHRLQIIINNTRLNFGFLWASLWNYHNGVEKILTKLLIAYLILAIAIQTLKFFGDRPRSWEVPLSDEKRQAWRDAMVASGSLIVLHVLAYSLFMPWRRYIEQVIPLVMIWAGLWFSYQLRGLFFSPSEKRSPLPARGLALFALALLVANFLTSFETLAKTLRFFPVSVAQFRDAIAAGDYIRERATLRKETPLVVSLNSNVPYYAHGYGYFLPYTEENPRKLFHYLSFHHINFTTTPEGLTVGARPQRLGIPLHHLLTLYQQVAPNEVSIVEEPGPIYVSELRPELLPELNEGRTYPVTGPTQINLSVDTRYIALSRMEVIDYTPSRQFNGGPLVELHQNYLGQEVAVEFPESRGFLYGKVDGIQRGAKYYFLDTTGMKDPRLVVDQPSIGFPKVKMDAIELYQINSVAKTRVSQ